MRLYLICFVALFFFSCGKYDRNEVLGEWEWVKSSEVSSDLSVSPQSTDSEVLLVFSSDTLKKYVNGFLSQERRYYLQEGLPFSYSIYYVDPIWHSFFSSQRMERTRNRLYLYDNCYTCPWRGAKTVHEYKLMR